MTDPMITATQHLEASPKPSYGPHKASERYLDDEDRDKLESIFDVALDPDGTYETRYHIPVETTLQALETLRTHLRKKYYAG